jgi:hypothetical protein
MKMAYSFNKSYEFNSFFRDNRKNIFLDDFDLNLEKVLSIEEKEKRKHNLGASKGIHPYYLVATDEDRSKEWSLEVQKKYRRLLYD